VTRPLRPLTQPIFETVNPKAIQKYLENYWISDILIFVAALATTILTELFAENDSDLLISGDLQTGSRSLEI